jgi:DNA-binding MarR family transcriptional regulator
MVECELTFRPGVSDQKIRFFGREGSRAGAWFTVLKAIATEDQISVTEVSAKLGLEYKNLLQHFHRLEAAGFIKRFIRSGNKATRWAATPDGRSLAEAG